MGIWECIPCERSIKKFGVRKRTWIGPQTFIKYADNENEMNKYCHPTCWVFLRIDR